jgi:UDP-N-acetyl-D-galactosamine dehydrogenase
MLILKDRPVRSARIGVLGITFKENVSDLRNSKVPDIVRELEQYGTRVMVSDPMASSSESEHEYGIGLKPLSELVALDALVLAVPHQQLLALGQAELLGRVVDGGILIDVKSVLSPGAVERGIQYWSL